MADLDDFFAKKDRKKSKGKKFATADEIAKKLEETGKRTEKLKKDKLQTSQSVSQEVDEQGNTIPDEDEWRDFEEEKKDYTGLKIQNLTLGEEEGDGENSGAEGDEDGGLEENEAGEMVPKKKQGPWRVVHVEEAQVQPPVAPPPKVEAATPKETGSYIPPSRRNQLANPQQTTYTQRFGGRMKTAPDVHSEELFPSLSSGKTQDPTKKKREEVTGFEEVRNSKSHTARYDLQQMRGNSGKLTLGNKFTALNHDQS